MPEYYCSIWGRSLSQLSQFQQNFCRSHGDSCYRCYCKRLIAADERPAPAPEPTPAPRDPVESLLDSLYL